MSKRCCTCKKYKSLNDFYKNKSRKDGYAAACKNCHRGYWIKYYSHENKENRIKRNERHRLWFKEKGRYKKYGITKKLFNQILNSQNGECKICSTNLKPYTTAIDHSHITGKVRGLLCRKCNSSLWLLENYKKQAIRYLNEI